MFTTENRCVLPNAYPGQNVYPGQAVVRLFAIVLLAVVTAMALLTVPVAAQRFKVIEPKMQPRAAKKLKSEVANAMRSAVTFQAGGAENIDRYFKTEYFPRMTQKSPEALADLGEKREGLIKVLRGSTVPAAQTHLTNLSLGAMRVLARENYHPSVRYNATLILGMLDQKYSSGGASPTAPEVLPAGTNELLMLLEQKEFDGVKVHPSVKVGALEGLERHVRFGLEAQYTDRVTQAALAVLAQEPSALDVDADVNNWIKCQAARLLSRQFAEGPNAEVHTALTKLIADDKMSLADRCCVVGLLEKIKFGSAAGVDVASTLLPLGNLTKAVVAEGAEKAQEYEDLRLGNAPRGGGRGFGGGRGAPQGPKLERRQLLACLTSIEKGAIALSAGLPEDQKQKVQSLTELLRPVMKISKNSKSSDLDVMGEVIGLENTVNNLIASWQPAAAAEPTDEDFAE